MTGAAAEPGAPLFSVAGKTAVVTGGCQGIGLMIASGLVDAGAAVIVTSRRPEALAEVEARLSRRGTCVGVRADVSEPDGIADLVAAVGERWDGRLDLLVNNAGRTWAAPLDEFPERAWDDVVDVNLKGTFFLTAALAEMLSRAGEEGEPARVINVGSVNGVRVPEWESYPYAASKAAVHMLTRHLAARLAPRRVNVNALAPGFFASKMTKFTLDGAEKQERVESQIPLGRIGTARDIVGAVLFLASPAGAYVTGTVLPVDGGLSGCV